MRSIQPIPTQRVPIVHAPSHTVFPVQRSERVIKDPQTGRSVSYDSYSISPEALRAHRAQYEAADMHLCPDCELVHAKGSCPLDEPIEERSDWNPSYDPAYQRALWVTVAVLVLIIGISWALGIRH